MFTGPVLFRERMITWSVRAIVSGCKKKVISPSPKCDDCPTSRRRSDARGTYLRKCTSTCDARWDQTSTDQCGILRTANNTWGGGVRGWRKDQLMTWCNLLLPPVSFSFHLLKLIRLLAPKTDDAWQQDRHSRRQMERGKKREEERISFPLGKARYSDPFFP